MQKSKDHRHARRAHAILLLHEGYRVSGAARVLKAARSAIQTWRRQFEQFGEAGLISELAGRRPGTVTEAVTAHLLMLIEKSPEEYGYLRSRWTSEMLAGQLRQNLDMFIHASTVRRLLPRLGVHWNRARPTLHIRDPKKASKMKAIRQALDSASEVEPVFYVDEVDIDLNPRIGACWTKKGQQATVPTPGKNQKRYLAGALNAKTGKLIWVEWKKKNSEIFILLLAELRKRYRRAKKITLIADNYIIHKSAMTKSFLSRNDKFKILFQPVYHPWVNKIELVWKQLHDAITRNHKFSTMVKLMQAVHAFMSAASPFPGRNTQMVRG
jgi:transposase